MSALDAGFTRLYGWRYNPLHQPGTMAVTMLLVLLATGLYLVFFYRIGSPAASVAGLANDPWLGRWLRSLHRYASDLFVIAAVFHAVRMFAQRRTWGTRRLAWVSGLFLLGIGLMTAWTGFVMAWDTFGARLAIEGARMLDVLPFFSEPLSRIFSGEGPVPNAFFFVNLFLHIALPLGVGVGLWLHVSRLARPVVLPPRMVMWTTIAALTVLAIALPAPLGPAANPLHVAGSTPINVVTSWWLPITEMFPPGVVWGSVILIAVVLVMVPRFTRPTERIGMNAPSVVDPKFCTGCNQCPQDCPWEAITMVARDDDRPTLVALVDPEKCVSCGLCAGSCPPMGVGPPGRSGRDQLAALRADGMLVAASNPETGAVPIVAICCSQAPASHLAALEARGARIRPVSCVGNLHSSVVEFTIRRGAPGVIVYGCPPRDCIGREGPKWLEERFFNDREAELQPRVDRARVRTATAAPGDLAGTLQAFDEFVTSLERLEQPPVETDVEVDIDLICEPVPMEVDAE